MPVKPGKGGFNPLGVRVLGHSRLPVFRGPAYPDPSVDKAALVGLNAPCNNIPQDQGAGQNGKPFAGKHIAPDYSANGYDGSTDVTAHPRGLPNHNPAGNR